MTAPVCSLAVGLLLACPVSLRAQPDAGAAALKKALEGREVTVLLDMPATAAGLDLYLQKEPELDPTVHARRLAEYGTALRTQDRVLITLVKVKKKNIEVQLGGGGYGTLGDDDGLVVASFVGKSARELELERERKQTTDARRKRDIERELYELQRRRDRENQAEQERARRLTAANRREIARKRLDAGSRFNIWYADKRLEQWVPTPEELMLSLGTYLEFGEGDGVGVPASTDANTTADRRMAARSTPSGSKPNARPSPDTAAASLRSGMSTAEVYELLGFPARRRPSREGELEASVDTWETRQRVVDVTFVNGVVVKVDASPKPTRK